jgi:methionine-rich copper-binding protein CopC
MQRDCVYIYTCQAGAHVKLLHSKIGKNASFSNLAQALSMNFF